MQTIPLPTDLPKISENSTHREINHAMKILIHQHRQRNITTEQASAYLANMPQRANLKMDFCHVQYFIDHNIPMYERDFVQSTDSIWYWLYKNEYQAPAKMIAECIQSIVWREHTPFTLECARAIPASTWKRWMLRNDDLGKQTKKQLLGLAEHGLLRDTPITQNDMEKLNFYMGKDALKAAKLFHSPVPIFGIAQLAITDDPHIQQEYLDILQSVRGTAFEPIALKGVLYGEWMHRLYDPERREIRKNAIFDLDHMEASSVEKAALVADMLAHLPMKQWSETVIGILQESADITPLTGLEEDLVMDAL